MHNQNDITRIIPKPFRDLLKEWEGRKITQEFNIQLCELTASIENCINDFRWKSLPIETQEYKKWRFMNKEEKEEFIKKNYNFYVLNIKNFTDRIDEFKNTNERNKKNLQEWIKLELTPEARTKIEEALDSYSYNRN